MKRVGVRKETPGEKGIRRRLPKDQSEEIENFRYEPVCNKLMIMRRAAPNEYLRRIREAVFGLGKETYLVTTLNDDELVIEDSRHGQKATLRRSQDEPLAAAP